MATEYRVIDCRGESISQAEIVVQADTAEHAARLALGEVLVRGSSGSKNLRARVYSYSGNNQLTLVRLYALAERTRKLAPGREFSGR